MTTSSLRIKLHNQRTTPQQLVLEPWGEVHELAADQVVTVVVTGTERAQLEVELIDEGFVIYGNPGDVIEVA